MIEARASTAFASRARRAAWAKWLTLLAGIVLIVCASAPARAQDESGCRDLPANAPLDRSVPPNIGLLQQQLIVYRCKQYIGEIASVLADARTFAAQLAPRADKIPAVVFDIDETSLSNWEAMYHNKFAYAATGPCDLSASGLCGQREWDLSARAIALAPTLDFFRFVKILKDKNGNPVDVFFVTGRYEDPSERIATEWSLRKEGFDGWKRLYMRPAATSTEEVSKYKTDSRKDIEKTHTIIVNVGDQFSDLIGEAENDHAEKCFKLPNPFYFIPPGLPEGGLKCLQR